MAISVIFLTYNDEQNIGAGLESLVGFTDDIIVIDSFSSDSTLDICRRFACRIYQHEFVDQAHQFNWALDHVEIKNDWILRLDSDEILPERLKCEMLHRVGQEPGISAYALNRRMIWMNRWLRHGRMYPHFITRLFMRGSARYELKTEEHLIVDGNVGYMANDFLEDNRNNTLQYFTLKHLKTAEGEVLEEMGEISAESIAVVPKLWGTKVERTRWLKLAIYSRVPLFLRPFLYFAYRYFFCLGFLDGKEGLIFHMLQAFWYRFYIDARIYENTSNWQMRRGDYRRI